KTAPLAPGQYRDEIVVTLPAGSVSVQAVGTIMVQKAGPLPSPPQPAAYTDPCATLASLRSARLGLLTGKTVTSVTIEGFQIQYSATDLGALERAIAQYDELC